MKYFLVSLLVISTLCISELNAQYIQYGNGINPPADFAAHPDDLAGLQALYTALDGPNWTIPNAGKWKATPLGQDGLTPFLYHRWYMVFFKPNHRVGKIIFWGGEGLVGAIPPEISLLSELEHFEIAGNSISDISELRNLPNLKSLIIKDCNLPNQIPCIVEDLPSLISMDLSRNQLTGSLPDCLAGSNSSLETLSIRENSLTGCIPESYDRFCSDLNRIYHFGDNSFENTIADVCNNVVCDDCPNDYPILWDFYQSTGGPNWTNITTSYGAVDVPAMVVWWESIYYQFGFTNWQGIQSIIEFQPIMTNVDFLSLINFYRSNQSVAWFSNCDPCGIEDGNPWKGIKCNSNGDITHVYLNSSGLVGTLPSSLSGLTSLQSLNLGNNQLSGSIPSSYSSLTNLQIWNMESNAISGQFPSFLVDFDYLQYLHLGSNNLSGYLPQDFSNLTYLKEFRVNNNQLSGGLSNTVGNCTQLIHFDASSNSLGGILPWSFGILPDLTHIYLDENNFTGNVPGLWGDLQSINRIDVSQNQLTGTELDNNLEKLCPINNITNYHINDGNLIDELWSMMCHCTSSEPGAADPNLPCCQVFTDETILDGDGNEYTAFRIGNQVWLQENLMTSSCLDGTPLPMYTEYNGYVWYDHSSSDKPLFAYPNNFSAGNSGQAGLDVRPYGMFYSQYIFKEYNSNITGTYTTNASYGTNVLDNAICKICPEGFRIANGEDFHFLKQWVGSKDLYDVTETCIKPVGGGFYFNVNLHNGVYVVGNNQGLGDLIWVSSKTPGQTQPWDVHFTSNGIETSWAPPYGYHLQLQPHYRSLRCIKE